MHPDSYDSQFNSLSGLRRRFRRDALRRDTRRTAMTVSRNLNTNCALTLNLRGTNDDGADESREI